jgi:serine/threonine-protein kinase
VRSICRTTGCVATASKIGGDTVWVSTLVFDDIGGRWIAVALYSGPCQNVPTEYWGVLTLQPRPDGSLSGELSTTNPSACEDKRAVTFTRTRDVDVNSMPDPATLAPRVVSPAEALHGRYHSTVTYRGLAKPQESDLAVRTDCLRTGDRCMSYFYGPRQAVPLVFGSGKWIEGDEAGASCTPGGTVHQKITAEYPLPQPPQDPIALLTGHGHKLDTDGPCAGSWDFDEKFARTGD